METRSTTTELNKGTVQNNTQQTLGGEGDLSNLRTAYSQLLELLLELELDTGLLGVVELVFSGEGHACETGPCVPELWHVVRQWAARLGR